MLTEEELEYVMNPFGKGVIYPSLIGDFKVVWSWSIANPSTIFIFKEDGREIEVNLFHAAEGVKFHGYSSLNRHEIALITILLEERKKEIK